MASFENPRQPLIDPTTSGGSAHAKYTEPLLPTTITITPNPIPSTEKKVSNNKNERRGKTTKREGTVKDTFVVDISRRLASMQEIKQHMSLINDVMCGLALVGIVLMIIVNEISFHEIRFSEINNTEAVLSWSLKLIMTITTIILVVLVIIYHRLDLMLHGLASYTDDWRIELTSKKLFLVLLEVIVCAIHPVVTSFPDDSNTVAEESSMLSTPSPVHSLSYVSLDVALGLPMFLRLYLLPRLILYHSFLAGHAGSHSIGYLSQVAIDFFFLMKTYLERWPIYCLSISCFFTFLIGSWSLRACDYTANGVNFSIFDAMWLFIETFTTVGYGDMYPSTYCGRGIAALIALFGILETALIIAVVAQQLMLNRGEKYVHNFVLNTELAEAHKLEAANIVKYSMKLWILKHKTGQMSKLQRFQYRKKLFESLNNSHEIKKEQRALTDDFIGLPEIMSLQRNTNKNTDDTKQKMKILEVKIDNVEEQLSDVKQAINNIQNTLNRLVDNTSA